MQQTRDGVVRVWSSRFSQDPVDGYHSRRRHTLMNLAEWSWRSPASSRGWLAVALVCVPVAVLSPYVRIPYAVAACTLLLGANLLIAGASGRDSLRRWFGRWAGALAPLLTLAGLVFYPIPLSRPPFIIMLVACVAAAGIFAATPGERPT